MLKQITKWLLSMCIVSCACVFLFAGQAFAISDVDKIIPTPQSVTYTENFMTLHNGTSFSACIVKGAKAPQAELEGVYLLQDTIARLCGGSIPVLNDNGDYSSYTTIITIGTTGTNSLNSNLASSSNIVVPDNLEGYAVRKITDGGKDYIVIAGREAIGSYYGAASMAQMINKSGSSTRIREVTISDWPSMSLRAVKDITSGMEGDFTFNDAIDWMKFLPKTKINVFSLCYTHLLPNWRTPSAGFTNTVKILGNYERDRGIIKTMLEVNAGYCGGLPVNESEKNQLLSLYKQGLDQGMSQIMSAFDDAASTDPNVHRDLTNYIFDRLNGQNGFTMVACPQAYNFEYYPNIASYLKAFTNSLRFPIKVVWTGNNVWSDKVTPAHVNQWKSYTDPTIQWTPFFWNNDVALKNTVIPFQQPSTPYFADKRVPFSGVSLPGGYIWNYMPQYTDGGVIENIFRQFTADKVYAIALADWMWNPAAYTNSTAEFDRAKRYWDSVVSNPAFSKTATASSTYSSSFGASKATDGLTSHRGPDNAWATAAGSTINSWLQVDLGTTQTLTGVNVVYREYPAKKAYCVPRSVTVQLSADGSAWSTVVSASTNRPAENSAYSSEKYTYSFSAASARYIKLVFPDGTQNTSDNILELSEVEAVTERPVTATANFALNKTAAASSQYSSSYGPALAVDGISSRTSLENCWATAAGQTVGAWWRVDLGSSQDLRTVRIKFREFPSNTAYCVPKTVTIQSSNDGSNWTTLVSRSANVPVEGGPYASTTYSYPVNGNGRYVRLLFEDGSQNSLLEISEVEVSNMELPNHQTSIKNQAFQRKASASTAYNGNYSADKACNGVTSDITKEDCWASALNQTIDAWWQADLGTEKTISRVNVIFREHPSGKAYSVPASITFQVSSDGTNWTTVLSRSTNVPAENSTYSSQRYTYTLNSSGRYVRLLFEDGSQNNVLVELSEVEIQ